MSASTTPTEYPCWASATARFVVTLDLPTPPLPDEMSSGRVFEPFWANGMMRPSAWPWAGAWPAVAAALPWRLLRSSSRSPSVITVNSRSIESTPSSAVAASDTRWRISFFSGQPGTVSAMSTPTTPSGRMSTPRSMPRSTIERCSSGSWTGRNASTTCASVTGMAIRPLWRRRFPIAPNFHYADRDNSARIQFAHGVEPVVHRNRVGDHRRVR